MIWTAEYHINTEGTMTLLFGLYKIWSVLMISTHNLFTGFFASITEEKSKQGPIHNPYRESEFFIDTTP
jgi:hypothetical protein